ncbi:glycosyltransferase family 2 protein, partial [Nodularia spumigena]|uniref:glycosyltransferase family 2 protein n=1 Tax=Nodularia spumigena TaxID=70799 RepID=UPI002B21E23F
MVLDCLGTLLGEIDSERCRVVVVDNHSGDSSLNKISSEIARRGWDGWVQVVEAGSNGGFSSGNNVGVRLADAEFYLLLNSDTLVRSGALAELLRAAEEMPHAGLIGPRLEFRDGLGQQSAFRRATPLGQFVKAAELSLVMKLLSDHVVSLPLCDVPHPADWVSFACVLVRREVFERVGAMDEGMFMYFEDIEFAARARRAGFGVWYWPRARVVHLRGGSSEVKERAKAMKRLPGYYYAARARYFHREFGLMGLIAANLFWTLGMVLNRCCWLVTRRPVHLPKKAWRDIWMMSAETPAGRRGVWIEPEVEPLFPQRPG